MFLFPLLNRDPCILLFHESREDRRRTLHFLNHFAASELPSFRVFLKGLKRDEAGDNGLRIFKLNSPFHSAQDQQVRLRAPPFFNIKKKKKSKGHPSTFSNIGRSQVCTILKKLSSAETTAENYTKGIKFSSNNFKRLKWNYRGKLEVCQEPLTEKCFLTKKMTGPAGISALKPTR